MQYNPFHITLTHNFCDDIIKTGDSLNIKNAKEKIKITFKKKFIIIKDQFTIENGMMTPTLKLKRYKIIKMYEKEIEKLF